MSSYTKFQTDLGFLALLTFEGSARTGAVSLNCISLGGTCGRNKTHSKCVIYMFTEYGSVRLPELEMAIP
eukprot:Gb_11286 [translate_table: standard]